MLANRFNHHNSWTWKWFAIQVRERERERKRKRIERVKINIGRKKKDRNQPVCLQFWCKEKLGILRSLICIILSMNRIFFSFFLNWNSFIQNALNKTVEWMWIKQWLNMRIIFFWQKNASAKWQLLAFDNQTKRMNSTAFFCFHENL